MMTTKQITDVLTVAVVAMGIFVGSTNADTLVSDDFSGAAGTDLVGTTADVGGTWTGYSADPQMKADGSIIAGNERSAYQAVTLVQGRTYTLSADVTLNTGSGAFIAIGFANSPGDGAGQIWVDANPSAWMYLNAPAWGIRRIAGPDLGGEVQIGPTVYDTLVNLKVVLDTTNPAAYQATWFIDGVQKDSTAIGSPALTHVFIYKHDGSTSGTVDNFLLEDDVSPPPTPGTLIYGK
jgi:hypothetical protein